MTEPPEEPTPEQVRALVDACPQAALIADDVRDEAILELARMVAGIARRCWSDLGTEYAGSINDRCARIIDALRPVEEAPGG